MEIRDIIIKENIKAKKNYGQNFLVDQNILKKIVESTNLENQNIIEIGPGLGSLTDFLAQKAKKLVCYEIDKDMIAVLSKRFDKNEKINIIHQDFLKIDIQKEIEKYFQNEDVILVANLPYYITTAILTKVLEETKQIKQIIVMVQKEVAMRLAGKPSTKDYNSLSVLIQYYTDTKILFNVSPKCFIPAPEVESSVISITLKKEKFNVLNEAFFLKFNRNIFTQRRKTLYNNIKVAYDMSKEQIESVLKNNNLPLTVRAESLTVEQIVKLYNDIYITINK